MKSFFKEPLVHFVILGAFIFLAYSIFQHNAIPENQIVIDDNNIKHMISIWKLQWQREPTKEELQGLINEYVDQEVFYREALRMNLDHDDEIVKRRLAQKMKFLSSDLATLINPPTEDNLKAFFKRHQDKYITGYTYDLNQIVFTHDRHKNPAVYADSLLKVHLRDNLETLLPFGDPIPLEKTFINVDESVLAREIGSEFTKALPELNLNQWLGPVFSGFGAHLVYISKRTLPRTPDFKEIKSILAKDYEYAMEKESEATILNELKSHYDIKLTSDRVKNITQEHLNNN